MTGAAGKREGIGGGEAVREEGVLKVELHLFLMDWYRHGGNFTQCLFDRAFRMHVSY